MGGTHTAQAHGHLYIHSSGESSIGLMYTTGAGTFKDATTACLEVRDMESLEVSLLQSLVVKRKIYNPLEHESAVGITNKIDCAFVMGAPVDENAEQEPWAKVGGRWQVNKNVLVGATASMLMGERGGATSGAFVALKSWWDPTVTLALSLDFDHTRERAKAGVTFKLENVGRVVQTPRPEEQTGFMIAPSQEAAASEAERRGVGAVGGLGGGGGLGATARRPIYQPPEGSSSNGPPVR